MSIPQVGQGSVAVVPTFKGFRKATDATFETAARSGKSIFDTGFKTAGQSAGKGFAASFQSTTAGGFRGLQAELAKAVREVSTLRIREADAAGRVRVAETALGEARRKYAADSLQVVRAEERLAAAQRADISAKERLLSASERLRSAQRELAAATGAAADAGARSNSAFGRLSATLGDAGRSGGLRFSQGFKDVLGGVLGANLITGIGYTIGREIGDAARAGFGYTLQAITLASDLEQSTGAVTAQFKDQSVSILGAAKTAATSVGLSRSTYQKYASIVGAQLKNLGIRQDQVAGKTVDLIELGADLAAQFGGPTSQAVEALSSLLRGERDPIERYGVSLKQTDIDARVAAMGMANLTGEAAKQATLQATLSLLWEQTADAQGTFFREQDTYAGKQQRLAAQLEDIQTRLGEAFLPYAIKFTDFVEERLPTLEGWVDRAGPKLQEFWDNNGADLESLVDKLTTFAIEGVPQLIDGVESMIDLGNGMADAWKWLDYNNLSWLVSGPKWVEGLGETWNKLFGSDGTPGVLTQNTSGFIEEGSWVADTIVDGVDQGLTERASDLTAAGTAAGKAISSGAFQALADAKGGMSLAGKDLAEGFALGLESKLARIDAAGEALGKASIRAIRKGVDANSPSKKAMIAGDDTGEGFGLGILGRTAFVAESAATLASASLRGLSSGALQPAVGGTAATATSNATTIDARQTVIVAPEQDARIVGRQYGREFVREIAGDAQ